MFVVDLRHWLLESGELAPQAALAPHMALVVECSTAVQITGSTAMVCRRHDARRGCPGHIAVQPDEPEIAWSCSSCDDAGVITGWDGTRWDLRHADVYPEDEDDDRPIYLPTAELRALRDLPLSAPSLRVALAAAPLVPEATAALSLTATEMRRVMDAVSSASPAGRARRRLDRAFGRIDHVRLAVTLERRARSH